MTTPGGARQLLERTAGVADWETWAVRRRETQLFVIGTATESVRSVEGERVGVTVYHDHAGPGGSPARGEACFDIVPSDTEQQAARRLEEGVYAASLASSPAWSLPGPAAYPAPEARDPRLGPAEAIGTLESLWERLVYAVSREQKVRLSAAEFFAGEDETIFANSRGAAASWRSTSLFVEFVLLAGEGGGAREAESYYQLTRRRAADFPVEETVAARARMARDGIGALPPPTGRIPVVVSGEAVAKMLEPFVTATSGESVYRKLSGFRPGDALLGSREIRGDLLTLASDGLLPYGVRTAAAAPDGLPMIRTVLVRDGVVQTLRSGQQYATYLGLPPAGGPGNLVVEAGSTAVADLLSGAADEGSFLHVVAFTNMGPDPVRGDFAGEIRFGYYHEGSRVGRPGRILPVHGGAVAGNVYDAFADARLSRETAFHGDYLGPEAVRFAALTVAGE